MTIFNAQKFPWFTTPCNYCGTQQNTGHPKDCPNEGLFDPQGYPTEAEPKFPPGTISEHRQGSAYLPEEVRTTSSTGGEKGTKSERYDLIPTAPLASLARLMGKGAEKYDDHNWRKGYEFSKSYSALMRHLQTWWEGKETIDPEMGESHLAAVIFHAMVMMELEKTHPEHDDRYKPEIKETTADIVMASMRESLNKINKENK